jgi:hypothetical protein
MAIGLTSLVVVVRDVNSRPLSNGWRRLWTTLTLIGFPFGGGIYWMVNCRGPRGVGPETPK